MAADTNSENHREWVDKVQFRNRICITINEDDSALKLSRVKLGSLQKARLGHFSYQLDSTRAVYVNFTGADKVGKEHSYYEGDPIKNPKVRKFFTAALNGETAENDLLFDSSRNLHWIE